MKFSIDDDAIAFAQSTLKVDGKEYSIKTSSYGDSVERADVESNSQIAIAQTAGMYKTDDSALDMFADDFGQLMEDFGDKFYTKSFEVTNAYQKRGSSKLTIDTLVGCRFTKRSASDSSGADPMMRNIGFKPRYIKWNGKNPFPNMPAGAK